MAKKQALTTGRVASTIVAEAMRELQDGVHDNDLEVVEMVAKHPVEFLKVRKSGLEICDSGAAKVAASGASNWAEYVKANWNSQ